MIVTFIKKRKKRKVRVVKKYEPKTFVTKEDKEIFNEFMKENIKEVK